ncbi:helix-turn-helix domain-containing protein [Sphingopyxis sp. JAI128]|uniref:helix-turn-helix domain-containing protein n=1 Tax=Sphingopyxis sp. JAI128 TaxID=2723066 RepID=UPI0016174E71|nr:helix-turn-helix domain-containing protein [Sphingopyxis sp. JAI128]MBB6427626.1 transcriptional regulator with XRE-family HTH domain [Sphingopyxis sp. JAI128]
MAIPAYIENSEASRGKPRSARHTLRLQLQGAKSSGSGVSVLLHNISSTGLLIESEGTLDVGDRIEIGLPHAGATCAKVIWASAHIYGCQFDAPISSATLSAAQLRSVVGPQGGTLPVSQPPQAESLGARLQRLRTTRGLTQSQIAKQLGVSEPSISAWEQDKARPKAGRMEKLAVLLGVELSELLGIEEAESLGDVVARAKNDIAKAAEISLDKIRIVIEI